MCPLDLFKAGTEITNIYKPTHSLQSPPFFLHRYASFHLYCTMPSVLSMGRLDLAVLFTPSTPNKQNRNQVLWNICAGVRRSTPSFVVVQTEQSRDLFQKRWRIIACMCGNILYRLINSVVLQNAQFYLFMWLFWRTPSTLKIAKSSPPHISQRLSSILCLFIFCTFS